MKIKGEYISGGANRYEAEIDISAESLIRQLKEQGFQELNLNINCPPEPPKAPPDLREKILKTIEDWDSADSCEESYQELTNQILALLPKAPPEPQYCKKEETKMKMEAGKEYWLKLYVRSTRKDEIEIELPLHGATSPAWIKIPEWKDILPINPTCEPEGR